MGGSFCCYNRFNILSQARNEQELSESINTLKNDIDYGLLYDLNKYSIKRSKNSLSSIFRQELINRRIKKKIFLIE